MAHSPEGWYGGTHVDFFGAPGQWSTAPTAASGGGGRVSPIPPTLSSLWTGEPPPTSKPRAPAYYSSSATEEEDIYIAAAATAAAAAASAAVTSTGGSDFLSLGAGGAGGGDFLPPGLLSAPSSDPLSSSSATAAPAPQPPPAKFQWGKMAQVLRESAPVPLKPTAATPAAPTGRPNDRLGNTVCTYYLSGLCRFGDGCRFRHVKALPWAVEFFEDVMKERLAAGGAGAGAGAGAGGDGEGSGGGGGSVTDDAAFHAASRAWQQVGVERGEVEMLRLAITEGVCDDMDSAEVALGAAERGMSRDVECGICLETVVDAPGRRFGLLTGCPHAFCLECIRAWRARIDLPPATVRGCPVCRCISYFVIPCDRFVVDPTRKAVINGEYLQGQKAIPCRNFDQGRGTCPFGSSCHYAHLLPNGQPAPMGKHTFLINTDGEIKGVGKPRTLSDFLFK